MLGLDPHRSSEIIKHLHVFSEILEDAQRCPHMFRYPDISSQITHSTLCFWNNGFWSHIFAATSGGSGTWISNMSSRKHIESLRNVTDKLNKRRARNHVPILTDLQRPQTTWEYACVRSAPIIKDHEISAWTFDNPRRSSKMSTYNQIPNISSQITHSTLCFWNNGFWSHIFAATSGGSDTWMSNMSSTNRTTSLWNVTDKLKKRRARKHVSILTDLQRPQITCEYACVRSASIIKDHEISSWAFDNPWKPSKMCTYVQISWHILANHTFDIVSQEYFFLQQHIRSHQLWPRHVNVQYVQ